MTFLLAEVNKKNRKHELLEAATSYRVAKLKTKGLRPLKKFSEAKIEQRRKFERIQLLQNVNRVKCAAITWINKTRKILKRQLQKELYQKTARRNYFRKCLNLWINNYVARVNSMQGEKKAKAFARKKLLERSLMSWRQRLAQSKWEYRYANKLSSSSIAAIGGKHNEQLIKKIFDGLRICASSCKGLRLLLTNFNERKGERLKRRSLKILSLYRDYRNSKSSAAISALHQLHAIRLKHVLAPSL